MTNNYVYYTSKISKDESVLSNMHIKLNISNNNNLKNSNSNSKEKINCEKCGSECTGNVCSVCTMVLKLKSNQT